MKSDKEIAKQFKSHKSVTDRGLANQRDNSALCDAFMVGDYMNYRDEMDVRGRRTMVQFSKPAPYVNAVHGFMAQNRRRFKYIARIEQAAEQESYSKSANAIAYYVRKNARADQIESVQNRQMLIKGYGAVETAMSYEGGYATRDPNGEIVMGDVTEEVGWDPMARDTNLLSARWCYYRKSYSLDDAKKIFRKKEEDLEFVDEDDETGYQYDPNIYPYDRSRTVPAYDWDSKEEKTVWVYFYQWQEIETFYRAENPVYQITDPVTQRIAMLRMDAIEERANEDDSMFRFDATAQELTFDAETKKRLEDLFEDRITVYDYPRKVFYTAVVSGDKVFKKYRNQSQQGFSVKFKTGYWDNKNKIWIGMVNPMMEPTKYYNKALTELMYTIAANSKGGWLAENGAIENIKQFEANANKTDGIAFVADGALQQGRVQPKRQAFQPTGYDQIIGLSDAAVNDASGIDPAFLGSSENKMQTAQLQRQLVKQVTSSLANYFDSEMAYLEEHARMLLDFMKVYAENNQGGIIRLVGEEEGAQFMRISTDAFAAEYDVDIVEAPQTQEEKLEYAEIINGMATQLFAVGDIAGGKAALALGIKYLPIDEGDKKQFNEIFQPGDDPRIAQLQAQLEQAMSEQNRVQLEAIQANTNRSLAEIQRIQADIQYKGAQIEKTASETALNAGKIEQIDLENQIMPSVELSKISVSV